MGVKKQVEKGKLLSNVSLAPFTSWHIGGEAEFLYWPKDLDDLKCFLSGWSGQKITWLGLGSNVLVPDEGLSGLVVITQGVLGGLELLSNHIVRAGAGVSCAQVARFAARNQLIGGEFLAGIPGTVGGALRMNAGAFGGETWDKVSQVKVLNAQGELITYAPNHFECAYRHVAGLGKDEWFVQADFCFEPGDGQVGLQTIKTLLAKRNDTQPTGVPTCGSVFRNPEGDYSARLIEAAGLKGYQVGRAQVSPKHANFIVNLGGAKASEVAELIDHVHAKVKARFGVDLVREVVFL